jgi:hypothetical protein
MALVKAALFFKAERRVENMKCGIFADRACGSCEYRYNTYCAYDGTDLTRAE